MRRMGWFAVALLLWSAGSAIAHEGGVDARGVVVTADAGQVTVRTANGKEARFLLTPETRIVIGKRAATPADLEPGLRAVVHGRKVGGGLEATMVRVSPAKVSRPPARAR